VKVKFYIEIHIVSFLFMKKAEKAHLHTIIK